MHVFESYRHRVVLRGLTDFKILIISREGGRCREVELTL